MDKGNALHDFLTEEESDELVKLDLSLVDPNPDQDRYDWDDPDTIEHIESLSISIGNAGDVTDPIVVIPSETAHGRYTLVDGECRERGAKMAGVTRLSAIVKKNLTLSQVSESALHTQTNKLKLKPIAMAKALQKRLDQGWDRKRLRAVTGKSDAWISKRLSLLDLPADVIQLADDGVVIDPDNLKRLGKLSSDERAEALSGLRSGTVAMKDIGNSKKPAKKKTTAKKPTKPHVVVDIDDVRLILSTLFDEHNVTEDNLKAVWASYLKELRERD